MLSVTIITKNEEKNINRFLLAFMENVKLWSGFLDEIIVVDSFSSDNTKSIATQNSLVKFFEVEFRGFGAQKALASSYAKNDWILNLDADEIPNFELFLSLKSFFENGDSLKYGAAYLVRDTVFLQKRLRFSGAKEKRLRLFNKTMFEWNLDEVHEDVACKTNDSEKKAILNGVLLHFSWSSLTDAILKQNRLTSQSAKTKLQNPIKKQFIYFNVFLRFPIEFLKRWLLQGGIFDGVPGVIFCYVMAFSQSLKYMKIYENVAISSDRKST